jgi:hypothetical protein
MDKKMDEKLEPYHCPICGGLEVDKQLSSAGDQYLFIPENGEFSWQKTDVADFGTGRVNCIDCGEDVTHIFVQYEKAGLVN